MSVDLHPLERSVRRSARTARVFGSLNPLLYFIGAMSTGLCLYLLSGQPFDGSFIADLGIGFISTGLVFFLLESAFTARTAVLERSAQLNGTTTRFLWLAARHNANLNRQQPALEAVNQLAPNGMDAYQPASADDAARIRALIITLLTILNEREVILDEVMTVTREQIQVEAEAGSDVAVRLEQLIESGAQVETVRALRRTLEAHAARMAQWGKTEDKKPPTSI